MSWENPFLPYANNKVADQSAHLRSLISTFVVHCLDSIMSLVSMLAISGLQLASLAEQTGLSLTWSKTPKTGFLLTRLIYRCTVFVSDMFQVYHLYGTNSSITITSGETSIQLQWPVTDINGSYFVLYGNSGNYSDVHNETVTMPTSNDTNVVHTISGLDPGQHYMIEVYKDGVMIFKDFIAASKYSKVWCCWAALMFRILYPKTNL